MLKFESQSFVFLCPFRKCWQEQEDQQLCSAPSTAHLGKQTIVNALDVRPTWFLGSWGGDLVWRPLHRWRLKYWSCSLHISVWEVQRDLVNLVGSFSLACWICMLVCPDHSNLHSWRCWIQTQSLTLATAKTAVTQRKPPVRLRLTCRQQLISASVFHRGIRSRKHYPNISQCRLSISLYLRCKRQRLLSWWRTDLRRLGVAKCTKLLALCFTSTKQQQSIKQNASGWGRKIYYI